MPIYEMQVRGDDKIRLVKATTAAQARDHIVSAKPISAERMGELIESGATLEKAVNPADPAAHAPGGELHDSGQGGGDGGGERERVNVESGLIQRHIGGEADDDDANWADVREATAEEIAAEKKARKGGGKP